MLERRMLVRLRRTATAIAAAGILLIGAAPAAAQSAATLYERALAREKTLRAAASPTVASLRALARNYEALVRKYPRSGYADNALWQAAGVLQLAAQQRSGSAADRTQATRLLQWLKREYPSSSLARQVDRRIAELRPRTPPRPPPTAQAGAPPRPSGSAMAPAGLPSSPSQAVAPAPFPVASEKPAESAPAVDARSGDSARPADETAQPRTAEPTASSVVMAPAKPTATPMAAAEAPAPGPVDAPDSTSVTLRSVAYTKLPKGDRLTLELTGEAPFTTTDHPTGNGLVLSVAGTSAAPAVLSAAATIRGTLVESVALEPSSLNRLEVHVGLSSDARLSTFALYQPYRLVIDIEAASATSASAARPGVPANARATAAAASGIAATAPPLVPSTSRDATPDAMPDAASGARSPAGAETAATTPAPENGPGTPASTRRGDYSLARQLGLGVSRVVIDPGHGGHDPGAQANGVSEADLVLDIALRLEALLNAQPGFEVVLTRRTNVFVSLEERTAIANREGADLFLSIHANSSPQQDTRGVETFVLNFASNSQAEAVAARENATSAAAMRALPDIVKAIATNSKLAESRELASMVQTSLMRRLGPLNRTIKDLGVRQAPFVVLIGAEMPSVLTEVSFLTNKSEAALLKQSAHKQRIAQALYDAVLKYQASLKKMTTLAGRSQER
jgi:N-acetylmuramoyl-L-alanine amidase